MWNNSFEVETTLGLFVARPSFPYRIRQFVWSFCLLSAPVAGAFETPVFVITCNAVFALGNINRAAFFLFFGGRNSHGPRRFNLLGTASFLQPNHLWRVFHTNPCEKNRHPVVSVSRNFGGGWRERWWGLYICL